MTLPGRSGLGESPLLLLAARPPHRGVFGRAERGRAAQRGGRSRCRIAPKTRPSSASSTETTPALSRQAAFAGNRVSSRMSVMAMRVQPSSLSCVALVLLLLVRMRPQFGPTRRQQTPHAPMSLASFKPAANAPVAPVPPAPKADRGPFPPEHVETDCEAGSWRRSSRYVSLMQLIDAESLLLSHSRMLSPADEAVSRTQRRVDHLTQAFGRTTTPRVDVLRLRAFIARHFRQSEAVIGRRSRLSRRRFGASFEI